MKWSCLLTVILLLSGCTYTDTGNWYEKPEEIGAYEPDTHDLVTVLGDLQSLLERTTEDPASVDCAQLETAIGPGGAFTFGAVFTECQATMSQIVYTGSFMQDSSLSEDNTVKEISIDIDVIAVEGPFSSETPIVLQALFYPHSGVYSSVSASIDGAALEEADIIKALEQTH